MGRSDTRRFEVDRPWYELPAVSGFAEPVPRVDEEARHCEAPTREDADEVSLRGLKHFDAIEFDGLHTDLDPQEGRGGEVASPHLLLWQTPQGWGQLSNGHGR
jgi:hypothetical protein